MEPHVLKPRGGKPPSVWKPATRWEISSILKLALRDEALCVPLTSRIKGQARGCDLYVHKEEGEVRDCFMFSSIGLFLPVFPSTNGNLEEIRDLVARFRPSVHSVMGIAAWVNKAERIMPLPPTTRVEYDLMTHSGSRFSPKRAETAGVSVHCACPADAELLFPLQKSYELEEVALNPAFFSDAHCMRLLRASLKQEVVFYAMKDGRPIAKAGTNARGYAVDQIGGVFTVPEERGKGLAGLVMEALLGHLYREKTATCLFVKKKNRRAISLYERLGYTTVTDYVISYFGL